MVWGGFGKADTLMDLFTVRSGEELEAGSPMLEVVFKVGTCEVECVWSAFKAATEVGGFAFDGVGRPSFGRTPGKEVVEGLLSPDLGPKAIVERVDVMDGDLSPDLGASTGLADREDVRFANLDGVWMEDGIRSAVEDDEFCRVLGRAGRSTVGGPEEATEGRGKVVAILERYGGRKEQRSETSREEPRLLRFRRPFVYDCYAMAPCNTTRKSGQIRSLALDVARAPL
jgi:hypothetical protein